MVEYEDVKAVSLSEYDDKFIGREMDTTYIQQNRELDFVEVWVNSLPKGSVGGVLLKGPTGTGKTLFGKNLAQRLDCDCITIDGSRDIDRLHLEGYFDLIDGSTKFVYGPVVVAVYLANLRGICILLINEVNAIQEGEQISLNSVIAEKEINLVSKAFEKHKLSPDAKLIVVGTMNPGYGGTFNMQEAFENRFLHKIEIEYPNHNTEVKIVQSASGCDDEVAKIIVDGLRQVRKQAQKDFSITKALSTRLMVEFAKSVSITPTEFITHNIQYAIINALADTREQKKSVASILDGKKFADSLQNRLDEIAKEKIIEEAKERGEDVEIEKATQDEIVKEARERFNIYKGVYGTGDLIVKSKGEIMLKALKWFVLNYSDIAKKYFELETTFTDEYKTQTGKDYLYRDSVTVKFCQWLYRYKQPELVEYMTEKYPVFSMDEA